MSTQLTPDMQGFYLDPIQGIDSLDYTSYSKISRYMTSPRGFQRYYLDGFKPKDTPAKSFGRILHEALLEPKLFRERHLVSPVFSGTGSRAAKKEWIENLDPGTVVITEDQQSQILFMLESISNHPEAVMLLKNSTRETNGYCYMDQIDTWFYYKLDFLLNTKGGLIIGDLKTTASAHPDNFGRDIYNYKYYIQLALYIDLTEKLLGKKVTDFPIIAVESAEPYITEVYRPPGYLVEMGRQIYLKNTEKIKHDIKLSKKNPKRIWAGYTGGTAIKEIDIPTWAYNKLINNEEYHD